MCSLFSMETLCDKGYEYVDKCGFLPLNTNKTKRSWEPHWTDTSYDGVCPIPRKTKRVPDKETIMHSSGMYTFI